MTMVHAVYECSLKFHKLNCYYCLQVFKFKMVDITWYVIAGCHKLMNNVIVKLKL